MPDPKEIMKAATRLHDERFNLRNKMLKERNDYRFRRIPPEVPEAYRDTNSVYMSPAADAEGKQVYALVEARPQPHIPAESTELQPLTTLNEQWLAAGDIELDAAYGMCLEKSYFAQIHGNIGWIYEAPKRNPYKDRPKAPERDASQEEKDAFDSKYTVHKREQGIAGFIERRYVPTDTVFTIGDVRNPLKFYEIKDVDEEELVATYNLTKDSQGNYKLPNDLGTLPSGHYEEGKTGTVRVIEYWDRQYMCILGSNSSMARSRQEPLLLEEWEHNFGRVPFFPCPAWENETLDEETKFSGPMDEMYAEIPHFNELMTMRRNVSHLRSYPSWQDESAIDSSPILDDTGKKKLMTKYQPGQIYHNEPGHKVTNIPMDASSDLLQEVMAADARIKQFSLDPVARGISPGADTANSAISQLSRRQRSFLERLAKNRAHQAREMHKFRLERLRVLGETVYVYDAGDKKRPAQEIGLSGDQVISLNVIEKYEPDTGIDNLLEEKQAAELTQLGLIPEVEFHERRGKENPEEYVLSNTAERLRKATLEPIVLQQVVAALGLLDAINKMIQEQAQSGDARNAVPGLMDQAQQMQNGQIPTGMGSGAGGMPRTEGVRSPALQETTQPGAALGY